MHKLQRELEVGDILNKKIAITLLIHFVLLAFIYAVVGLNSNGIIAFVLVSVISFSLVMAFIFEPSKRNVEPIKMERSNIFEPEKSKTCYICNTVNKDVSEYCKKCGTSLVSITCPVCNTRNQFDQKYCIECETILQNKIRH
ncbi:zinc ribbon domain-containing protein [Candidatus Izimaplasma bacterium]|nr:zinc ribbon domain-containing protein [Candidatus Izimaplasma bacterium]